MSCSICKNQTPSPVTSMPCCGTTVHCDCHVSRMLTQFNQNRFPTCPGCQTHIPEAHFKNYDERLLRYERDPAGYAFSLACNIYNLPAGSILFHYNNIKKERLVVDFMDPSNLFYWKLHIFNPNL